MAEANQLDSYSIINMNLLLPNRDVRSCLHRSVPLNSKSWKSRAEDASGKAAEYSYGAAEIYAVVSESD